ncbi:hypothetical protein G7B40_022065 [Aetokthonos hydrillicola Thurmond2011]|jgi:hypothetical protein|uniref:Uncharacterized protein n=1 Tax=Aetokthonos hydrillicola Thurmond2011 TaxID=2712845 RepID=A0AAP5MBS9_9CYAN|nr:hypothetical protein [Aetokthonos hydrillicola]MBO3463932.1 hypothetical protein [Aetokthonos hydrillicola CCALA 1050]MBW4588291.1 hypothetical protein [Aetokthonos hydrillicola CCALA 1050]MDR9897229.1 hypothetical protein [Aetokthonos hydrillicola Thurmond2011]
MTTNNIRQQILEHLETLPGEQVKTLLLTWLTSSSGDLEDFEQLLTNQPTENREESFDYGEIDTGLNFQTLTEAEMIRQSQSALEAYLHKGSGVSHERVREWVENLGTDTERPCPR